MSACTCILCGAPLDSPPDFLRTPTCSGHTNLSGGFEAPRRDGQGQRVGERASPPPARGPTSCRRSLLRTHSLFAAPASMPAPARSPALSRRTCTLSPCAGTHPAGRSPQWSWVRMSARGELGIVQTAGCTATMRTCQSCRPAPAQPAQRTCPRCGDCDCDHADHGAPQEIAKKTVVKASR